MRGSRTQAEKAAQAFQKDREQTEDAVNPAGRVEAGNKVQAEQPHREALRARANRDPRIRTVNSMDGRRIKRHIGQKAETRLAKWFVSSFC